MLSELDRRPVVETRMWPHGIVVPAPDFDNHLRFTTTAEPLQAQAFVAEAAIEALVGTVLPGLTRVDQCRLDAGDLEPLRHMAPAALAPSVDRDGRLRSEQQERRDGKRSYDAA